MVRVSPGDDLASAAASRELDPRVALPVEGRDGSYGSDDIARLGGGFGISERAARKAVERVELGVAAVLPSLGEFGLDPDSTERLDRRLRQRLKKLAV